MINADTYSIEMKSRKEIHQRIRHFKEGKGILFFLRI